MTEICYTLLMVSVAYGKGQTQKGRMRGMHPPISYFLYIFSIILNLFDSNMCEQIASYLAALRIRVKKLKQNLPENYSKSTKIAITACKFSKIFRDRMSPDPPKAFLVSQSAWNLLCRKETRWKKCGNYAPPPFKTSRYAIAEDV